MAQVSSNSHPSANFKFKVCSLNVRGLNEKRKRNRVAHFLKSNQIEVACIQETHCIKSFKRTFEHSFNKKDIFHSFSESTRSKGVAVIFSKNSNFEINKVLDKFDGRTILVQCTKDDHKFLIANIYAPNKITERCEYLDNLIPWILENAQSHENIILSGDQYGDVSQRQTQSKY